MPCLGNCLGSSSSESVDLRKQSTRHRLSTINENNETNLPKAESYKKLRNSFLGAEVNQPITTIKETDFSPPTTTINKLTDKKKTIKSKKLSTINKNHETHPKIIYLTDTREVEDDSIVEPMGNGREIISMEPLEPLLPPARGGADEPGSRRNFPPSQPPPPPPPPPLPTGHHNNPGDMETPLLPPLPPPPPSFGSMDFNLYAAKKNISQGLIDIALLTANFSQLKFILSKDPRLDPDWTKGGPEVFNAINLILICFSIGLQILVGIALLLSSRLNLNDDNGRRRRAETCNTLIIVCVFIITVINIFIVIFLDGHDEFELV